MRVIVAVFMGMLTFNAAAKKCAPESPSLLNFACEMDETWILGIGAGAEFGSEADGSKETGFELEPGAILHVLNEWGQFFFDGQEVGFRFFANERLNFMLGGRFEPGRTEADDPVLLEGQGDSDDELMGRAEFRVDLLGNWNLWTGVSSLIGQGSIGSLHILALGIGMNKWGPLDLELLISQRFGTSAFINKDFGVDETQSARNGLPVYKASTGRQSFAATLLGKVDVAKRVQMLFEVGYDKYSSRIDESPIIQRGQDYEYEVGATILYLF